MTFKLANRIKETSDTTGTGDINLTGSLDSFETFSSILSDGDTTFYVVEDSISATSGTFTTIKSPTNTDLFLAPSGEAAIVCDKSITVPYNVESDASTITFNMHNSNIHTVTLGGNRNLAVSNVDVGQIFILQIKQMYLALCVRAQISMMDLLWRSIFKYVYRKLEVKNGFCRTSTHK